MPQRAYGLLIALLGIVAVAGLLVAGVDVWLSANRGPRWKRALLGAGLALACWLGIAPGAAQAGAFGAAAAKPGQGVPDAPADAVPAEGPGPAAQPIGDEPKGEDPAPAPAPGDKAVARDVRLSASADWNEFAATLADAREIASGAALLDLARIELHARAARVIAPGDRPTPTCYTPTPTPYPPNPIRGPAGWLQNKLPLIEGLAAAGKVRSVVLERVLGPIESNLSELGREDLASQLKPEERSEIDALRSRVGALVEKLKAGK